jgi:hypothetical protein
MSPAFKSFLQGLLAKGKSDRLGWPNLMNHPFVRETDEECAVRTQASNNPLNNPRYRLARFLATPTKHFLHVEDSMSRHRQSPLAAAARKFSSPPEHFHGRGSSDGDTADGRSLITHDSSSSDEQHTCSDTRSIKSGGEKASGARAARRNTVANVDIESRNTQEPQVHSNLRQHHQLQQQPASQTFSKPTSRIRDAGVSAAAAALVASQRADATHISNERRVPTVSQSDSAPRANAASSMSNTRAEGNSSHVHVEGAWRHESEREAWFKNTHSAWVALLESAQTRGSVFCQQLRGDERFATRLFTVLNVVARSKGDLSHDGIALFIAALGTLTHVAKTERHTRSTQEHHQSNNSSSAAAHTPPQPPPPHPLLTR